MARTDTPKDLGNQEEETSEDELTPKYLVDKASERTRVWGWFGGSFGYEGPAWLFLILLFLGLISAGIVAL